jgi:hypothetical protein
MGKLEDMALLVAVAEAGDSPPPADGCRFRRPP